MVLHAHVPSAGAIQSYNDSGLKLLAAREILQLPSLILN